MVKTGSKLQRRVKRGYNLQRRVKRGSKLWYLLVVEDIEVKVCEVTVREKFDGGEILIEENGIAIPKCYQETSGVVEEFGTLAFK